jgi:quinol monooxygenase YgiN
MLLIIGRFQVKRERLAEFQALARELVAEERRVPGCVGFELLQDVGQDDAIVMLEQWRDQAALDAHLSTDAYARNEARLSAFMVEDATWDEYVV